ncbi:MAG: hypothetical protein WC505_08085, partial [Patescibacteria group bacterium]
MELAFSSALRLLIDRDDVTHVMVGLRFRGKRWTDERCISIGVQQKRPLADLSPDEIIPAEIRGIPTDVIQSRPKLSSYVPTYATLGGGVSISPEDLEEDSQQLGTLGGVFWDDVNACWCGLTNYHVLARGSAPMIPTDKVIHPGMADGGRIDGYGRIGSTSRYGVDELGDAAIFTLSKAAGLSMLDTKVILTDAVVPDVDDVVEKVGRSTGTTQGIVTAHGYVSLDYSDYGYGSILMAVFAYTPLTDPDEEIVAAGDSGSVVYRVSDSVGMGLHVAHDTDPVVAYACYLTDQMTTLQFSIPTLITRHGIATASLSLGRRCYGQAAGSLSAADTDSAISIKGFAVEDSYTSYDTLEEYAVAQGYADEAAFLAAQGYATALEFAESEGYDSIDAFLAGQTIPSLQW